MNRRNIIFGCVVGAVLSFVALPSMAGEALDRVLTNKVLKVATDANWAPQSFINDKNEMDGFDVDVAREVAKRLGVKVEFVTPSWDIITAGNWNGRWDLSVGSMAPTKSRAKVLSFPAVYYYTPASAAVHNDSTAQVPSDLDGKIVGATTSSTFEFYLNKDLTIDAAGVPDFKYQITPREIRSYKDTTAVMDDLRLGNGTRLDGMVASLPAILSAIKSGYPFKVLGEPLFYEPLALAIDRGDQAFNDKLAEIVKSMQDDGTLHTLSIKWYGVDYTKAKVE